MKSGKHLNRHQKQVQSTYIKSVKDLNLAAKYGHVDEVILAKVHANNLKWRSEQEEIELLST